MKNRFIDLLIEKNRKAEETAMKKSWGINDQDDPTQFDPWKDKPSKDDNKK
ncbi:MAG: hypothetical protein GY839_00045 [candidate division Zixibacteria bacterium]|nr:hypothetical protein [candidate division Zixibacteria bacterium]